MNFPIPPEAVVVLSKGLSFVPNPKKFDVEELRLDTRQFTNRLAIRSIIVKGKKKKLPSKLKTTNYHPISPPNNDTATNNVITSITNRVESIKSKNLSEKNTNLSKLETEGVKWLQTKTSQMEIVVDTADKGGAILVYPPELTEQKIMEKVNDKRLYVKMNKDPSDEIYDELIEIWKEGKAKEFISEEEACKIVGLTSNNNKSTASRFKPGDTYFNPSL